jgi:hypothetical protein
MTVAATTGTYSSKVGSAGRSRGTMVRSSGDRPTRSKAGAIHKKRDIRHSMLL